MDLHSKMTMYVTSTITSPVTTKTAKTSKWLRFNCQLVVHVVTEMTEWPGNFIDV